MRSSVVAAIALALLPSVAVAAPRTFSDGTVDVAIVFDGEWAYEADFATQLRKEITSVVGESFTIQFPDDLVARGDWTRDGVQKALDGVMANPKVDLVVTAGMVGSDLVSRSTPKKPTFAAFVVDATVQGLPATARGSGVKTLAYLSLPTSITSDLQTLVELAPAEQIAVLVAKPLADSMDSGWRDRLAASAPEGTTVSVVEVDRTAAPALAALGAEVDSVYLTPLGQLSAQEREVLAAGLLERKLPGFAMYGADWVDLGLLAARPADSAVPAVLRRLGLDIERFLNGDDPGTLSTTVDARPPLLLNADTARKIGASPSWEVLSEARLVETPADESTRTTLKEAAKEALVANTDLSAAAQEVEAGQAEVGRARAPLLPDIAFTADAQIIDADRAKASLGMIPQAWGYAGLELTQVILDDERLSDLGSEKARQESRVADYDVKTAETIVSATDVYLEVLRAKTQEELERQNLGTTRKNLDLARVRERIGAGSPAEVYRWEVEVTTDQRHLLEASSQLRTAELGFNRALNRPLDSGVLLADATLTDTEISQQSARLIQRLEDPLGLDRLAGFLVNEAMRRSPEIAALTAQIDADERELAGSKRSYFLPTLTLNGRAQARLFWAGESAEGGIASTIPGYVPQDWFSWYLGANLRLPLLEGGGRKADTSGKSADVAQARLDYEAEVERVDERVRSALIAVASSWRSVALAERGSESAHKGLDATTVSYGVGSASVLDLLDAQDITLESDTAYVDANYAFHRDLFAIMKATNRFLFLDSEEDRTAFFDAMDSWMGGLRGASRRPDRRGDL